MSANMLPERIASTRHERALTFDDVLLVPAYSEILPSEVDVRARLSKNISLNIPIISAPMDSVTESALAIALAQQGGLGIIHRNLGIEEQVSEVRKVKRAEYWIVTDAVTISPNEKVSRARELMQKNNIGSFPVIENGRLVGILTNRDLLFEDNPERQVSEIMSTDLITTDRVIGIDEAKKILHENRIEKLPIVDAEGRFRGLITVKDIEKRERYPDAARDAQGRLLAGADVGPKDFERIKALADAEVDAIVIGTAHGHSKNVIECTKYIKKNYPQIALIAGNIATREGAEALISAGADALRVGIGPGSICTTRIVAGVGVPQITAINECAEIADKHGISVIGDGGIRSSGDIAKAIAAGASCVMLGNMLAGTEETPGRTTLINGRKYKQYRGMGSLGAMAEGSKARYGQSHIQESSKLVPEGVEGLVPYRGTLEEIIYQLIGGLRSSMGYVGAKNIEEMRNKPKFLKITKAGVVESHPHDIIITDETPNYPAETKPI